MASHDSTRPARHLGRRLGATSLGFGALVIGGLAGTAAAHTPTITSSCGGLAVQLRGYQDPATNNVVTVTIDGVTTRYTYGNHSYRSFRWDPLADHTYSIVIDANTVLGEPTRFDRAFSGSHRACPPATTTTTPAPATTVPPVTTPDSTTPVTTPVSTTPDTTVPATTVPGTDAPTTTIADSTVDTTPSTDAPTTTVAVGTTTPDTTPASTPDTTTPDTTPVSTTPDSTTGTTPETTQPVATTPDTTVVGDSTAPDTAPATTDPDSATGLGVASGTPTNDGTADDTVTTPDAATSTTVQANDVTLVDVGVHARPAAAPTVSVVPFVADSLIAPSDSTLPATGGDPAPQVVVGSLAMLAGFGLVRIGRRRREKATTRG